MPDRSILIRAGVGALLIGVGCALMISATKRVDAMHEVSPEQTADEVATAGAELAAEDIDD